MNLQPTTHQLPTVAILLTTYNSEAFLPQQLNSLQAQSYVRWQLYVHDDGSTDDTLGIIRQRADDDARIHLLHDDRQRGAKESFAWLMETVDASYYMFCDHDDVWLPQKVERTMQAMLAAEGQVSRDTPVMVFTDLCVVDEQLKELAPSFWKMNGIDPFRTLSFARLGPRCVATGCTMMFNHRLRDLALPIPAVAEMHDVWVALVAAKYHGCLVPLPEQLILYRQHGDNVIGAQDTLRTSWWSRLCSLGNVINGERKQYAMLKALDYGSPLKYMAYKLAYHLHL